MSDSSQIIAILAIILGSVLSVGGWSIYQLIGTIARLQDDVASYKRELKIGTDVSNRMTEEALEQSDRATRYAGQVDRLQNPHRSELVDRLLATETDDLERARDAWYRLKVEVQHQLSLNDDGTGPLFSASKPAMAERALLSVVTQSQSDAEDWDIVSKWLGDHPGQHDKLG